MYRSKTTSQRKVWLLFVVLIPAIHLSWYWLSKGRWSVNHGQTIHTPTAVNHPSDDDELTTKTNSEEPGEDYRVVSSIDVKGIESFSDMTYTKPKLPAGIMLFKNVHIKNNTITVYYNKDFKPPLDHEHALNWFSWNSANLTLPTQIVELSSKRVHMQIKYVPADKEQPTCSKWFNTPTLLMHISWPDNFYHTMREGIVASFQTLRELGLLQMIRIDEQGNIQEIKKGKGDYCIDIDTRSGHSIGKSNCWNYPDLPVPKKCNPKADSWCRPGVHTLQSIIGQGPILLPILEDDIVARLQDTMYSITPEFVPRGIASFSEDDGSSDGGCFKELYAGFSPTFDPYYVKFLRRKKQVRQTLVEWLASSNTFQSGDWWQKYADLGLKELRKGVDASYLPKLSAAMAVACGNETLVSIDSPAADDYRRLKEEWLNKADAWYKKRTPKVKSSGDVLEKKPVVTFMTRRSLKTCNPELMRRSLFNLEDILEYILRWYDVTLKVATFQEPLPEVVKLLQSTDVLIGMHGAGWTNSLFIKEGSTALQLMPYGWRKKPNKYILHDGSIRGGPYARMVEDMSNSNYFEWHSPHPSHAFFHKVHFFSQWARNDTPYILHPNKDTPRASHNRAPGYWINQNTYVDIIDLADTIDAAMQTAGINRREKYVPGDVGGKRYWRSVGLLQQEED